MLNLELQKSIDTARLMSQLRAESEVGGWTNAVMSVSAWNNMNGVTNTIPPNP